MIVLGYFAAIAASIFMLSIVTEDFFIPSLDQVAKRFNMPSDIAGASLMAVGSSAPELFIALLALFIGGAHADVGVGTIVGSAVFNILVITGASAAIAGNLAIKRGSVERDIAFYLGSVILLLIVFWDATITAWEAFIFVAAYVMYLVVLFVWGGRNKAKEPEFADPVAALAKEKPKSIGAKLGHFIQQAFKLIARDPIKNYWWSMLISVAAIAVISYILVETAIGLSDSLNLPPVIVSLTLLAAATSVPDLIASVNVAKQGRGNMAVSNAVGSNIFDILIGLGVPWLIAIFALDRSTIVVDSEGLLLSIAILGATTVVLYFFLFTRRTLARWEGIVLLLLYVVYIAYVVLAT